MKFKILLHLQLLAIVLVSMGIVGCKKSNLPQQANPTMEDINVPDGFNFETTREINVKITMPASLDFTELRSRFDVYSATASGSEKLIASGSFDKNGEYDGIIRIPTSLEFINVRSIAGNATVEINETTFKEGGVIINFGGDYGHNPPDSITESMKAGSISQIIQYSAREQNKVMANAVTNGDFELNDYGAIYYWDSPHPVDGRWYFTQKYATHEWYNDGGNNVVRTPYVNGYCAGGVSQMISVNPDDILTFATDIKSSVANPGNRFKVWLFLIPKDASGNDIEYFEYGIITPTNSWERSQMVATMPQNTVSCQVLIWSHDLIVNQSIMYDNVEVTISQLDSDGDGVEDDLDDYPNDPERAFNVFYPNETDWGTLVYEDLWPATGDYDLNDLVLDYHFKSVLNAQNGLVEFFTDYSVRAVGASLHNAFGFSIGGDPANVASVTGSSILHGELSMNANGTEQGQTETVIFMFDDAFDMIGSSGSTFSNTQPGIAYVEPDTGTVHVLYQTPVSVSTTGTAPYNPFLVANLPGGRGTEVHLPGNLPTLLADQGLLGQWSDDSKPASGKYYQTEDNLPWALDIPESFEYPIERIEIINAYNHFVEWAESGGAVYTDWYQDNAGYRNNANIYSPAK